jgi:hypothetical protein
MGLNVSVATGEEILRPFRADLWGDQIPRALPWASQLRAVGAAERNDLAVLMDGLKSNCGFFTARQKAG